MQTPPKNRKTALFGLCTGLIIMAAISYAVSEYTPAIPLTNVNNDPLSLGVVNARGEWIVPPLYQEVVYLKSPKTFWVKERQPSPLKYLWLPNILNSIGKNPNWKLLDRNGKTLNGELPAWQEPLREWPASQALGVSFYNDEMLALSQEGCGIDNARGKPLSAFNYHSLADVGDNIWLGQPGQEDEVDKTTNEKLFPGTSLGNPFKLPPAVVLLDHNGKRLAKLPKGVWGPDGFFVKDMLVCKTMGGPPCAFDKSGRLVISPGSPLPPYLSERHYKTGAPRAFNCIYRLPISASAPLKFIDGVKPSLPSELVPVAVAENLALVSTQDDMYGLVNRKGEWIIKPDYNRLAYGDSDRLICSKGRLSMDMLKARKLEITKPDIR